MSQTGKKQKNRKEFSCAVKIDTLIAQKFCCKNAHGCIFWLFDGYGILVHWIDIYFSVFQIMAFDEFRIKIILD